MTATNDQDLSRAPWRKSSYSGNGNNCVEAASVNGHVVVRDTADRGGAAEVFSTQAWQRFTARVKRGGLHPSD
jgi:Domain of unknown function (DUF397)